jgi:glycosyltransferase involved in cell wall biosynthesis
MPQLSVVVASHDRPLRLRWLLNALAEQTLDSARWEVVVCHDSAGPETDELLRDHELARLGILRHTRLEPGTALPGTNRNAALKLALAETVVFTDDDCRPPPEWLEGVLAAVVEYPGAIIQGPVLPDPDEAVMLRSAHPRTQGFTAVPRPWAECCNIAYPRPLLDELGPFAQDMRTGEDAELNQRALCSGAAFIGDQRMLSYHAVDEGGLLSALRLVTRWADLALLVKRQPRIRRHLFARVFWKREHALLLLAVAGTVGGRGWLLLAMPWAFARNAHGPSTRGRLRQLAALPGWALIDAAEIGALARASAAQRTLIL